MTTRLRSTARMSSSGVNQIRAPLADQVETTRTRSEGRTRAAAAPRAPKGSELATLKRVATVAYLFSLVIIGGAIYFAHHDILRLYPRKFDVKSLLGFNSRFEYCLRYQTPLFLWLMFNIHSVIYVRLTKSALNPLVESTEKHAQMQKNILTNSFEQIMVSVFLQLAFASFADPESVLKYIPAVNLVQFLGRIAFFFGYPYYRTLGVSLTLTPNLLMLGFNVYRFGSFVGFY